MLTRKADFHWSLAPQWCMLALVLSGTTAVYGQLGSHATDAAAAPEQQLFPKGLPKIEVMFKAALEHHPEVLAARSKLRTAEAEQRQAELKAFKDLIAIRDRWEKANFEVAQSKEIKAIDPAYLSQILANQAAVEWELAFILGLRAETAEQVSGAAAPDAVPAVILGNVIPKGKLADAIQQSLTQQVEVEFSEIPLREAFAYLSAESGLRFVLDNATLEENGIPGDLPITCQLGKLELATALQALEDLQKPLYFVVRDYGILVTTESQRSSKTVSACDFAKLTPQELQEKLQQQRQDEADKPRGGTGGGFF